MEQKNGFIEKIKSFYRPTSRKTDNIPVSLAQTFALILAGQFLGLFIVGFLFGPQEQMSPPMLVFNTYMGPIGIWIITLLPILLASANRPMLKAAGPKAKGNTLFFILFGLLLGFAMNAFCVLMSVLLKDIALSFFDFDLKWFLLLLLAVTVQSGAEEIVCRFYLYQKLRRRFKNPWVAILVNSLFFAVLHMSNDGANFFGIAQCFTFGLMASILVWKYNSLWGAIFLHAGWNFTQSILFGLPNSGVVFPYSVFKLEAASAGIFFDPAFGVEGSPAAFIIQFLVIAGLYIFAVRNNYEEEDLWAEQEQKLLTEQNASENI